MKSLITQVKSLKWKFVLTFVAVVFIAMIASGTFIYVSFRNAGEYASRSALRDAAYTVYNEVLSGVWVTDSAEEVIRRFNESPLLNQHGIEYSLLSGEVGQTIATTTVRDGRIDLPQFTSGVIVPALNGNDTFRFGRSLQTVDGYEKRYAEFAIPVFARDIYTGEPTETVQFVIYVRKDVNHLFADLTHITQTIAISMLFALAATVVVGILFASSLTKPLAALTQKTKEFSAGNFPEELPVYSDDEAGQLTESFNKMAQSLAETMSEIVREKNRNEIVLFNMTDGVLAYDAGGNLIHCNNACYDLLGFADIATMDFAEMMQVLGISAPETGIHNDDFLQELTLFINDKYINAAFNPHKNVDGKIEGIIIVLQDITRHKRLDNMRKEFVANVSHEIRTPLTTIKSYSETLIEGAVDDKDTAMTFLNVINGEADRMMLLVNDLLELSRSDDNRMDLKLKEIDLRALVEQNVEQHKMTAGKQDKTISFSSSLGQAGVIADPDRINQVINNIISNSFKYSSKGSHVGVSVEESDSYYRVYVRDNGMGIPQEDLGRIFERFYRVDKARSRAMGGTGLGLAIAKEIMEAHGGQINAVSEFGKGTTMVLRFPKG